MFQCIFTVKPLLFGKNWIHPNLHTIIQFCSEKLHNFVYLVVLTTFNIRFAKIRRKSTVEAITF